MLVLLSTYALPLELSPEQYGYWDSLFNGEDLVLISF